MDLMRAIPPEEKLRRAIGFTEMVRKFSQAGIRQAYPEASEREVFLRAAQRQLGNELFQKVFGEEWREYGPAERHA